MLTMLQGWKGNVVINDVAYNTISDAKMPVSGPIHIVLRNVTDKAEIKPESNANQADNNDGTIKADTEYLITVKKYMTQPTEPNSTFDFMAKWNNNVPMPLRTMVGTMDKETRGMVHMKLHGDIYAEKICTCMRCGRKLTNPVSQFFGIGPECGGHNYVNPFESDEELKEAVSEYRKQLHNITMSQMFR